MFTVCLLGLIPVHMLYINNMKEISLKEYIETILLMILLFAVFYHIFLYLTNMPSAIILTLLTWFFTYSYKKNSLRFFTPFKLSRKHIKNTLAIVYFTFLAVILFATALITRIINIIPFIKLLFWSGVILNIFIIINIYTKFKQNNISKEKRVEELLQHAKLDVTSISKTKDLPDIYHLILDAHPGFHNPEITDEEFKNELIKRKFRIFENHYSNYDYTNQSIPSVLQMEYFKTDDEVSDVEANNDHMHWSSLSNNLFKYLISKSYNLNLIYPEYKFGICKKINDKINIYCNKDTQKYKLLNMIKFNCGLSFKTSFLLINSPNEILYQFDKFASFKKSDSPNYNFCHILAPHAPHWFDENGKVKSKGDGKMFSYIKFCNKKTITAIDEILKNNKKAIIIVHSDHGITENKYRYRILSTIYLPEKYANINIPDKITLVNLFRYILNGMFNENYAILENKFFHMGHPESLRVEQIDSQFAEYENNFYN